MPSQWHSSKIRAQHHDCVLRPQFVNYQSHLPTLATEASYSGHRGLSTSQMCPRVHFCHWNFHLCCSNYLNTINSQRRLLRSLAILPHLVCFQVLHNSTYNNMPCTNMRLSFYGLSPSLHCMLYKHRDYGYLIQG